MYRIVRMFSDEAISPQTILVNLTLEQAQAHCKNPETAAKTCTSGEGAALTRHFGTWFDGYELQPRVHSQ